MLKLNFFCQLLLLILKLPSPEVKLLKHRIVEIHVPSQPEGPVHSHDKTRLLSMDNLMVLKDSCPEMIKVSQP